MRDSEMATINTFMVLWLWWSWFPQMIPLLAGSNVYDLIHTRV